MPKEKPKRRNQFDCVDAFLVRYRGFLEACPYLIDTLTKEEFLKVHEAFHKGNAQKLHEELKCLGR